MLDNKKIIIVFIVVYLIFFLTNSSLADNGAYSDIIDQTLKVTEGAGYSYANPETELPNMIANIIQAFLGLLGIIFLVLIIYAGYNWMTAAGEEEKVTKAKETLTRAVIGLIIIVAAYSITYFVFKSLSGGGLGANPDITVD